MDSLQQPFAFFLLLCSGWINRQQQDVIDYVRYVVFFVMKLKTRTVKIAGITSQANELWMNQMARNLTRPA